MAKRELSSTLKNLKFMQRAREKEEIVKKEEEERKIIPSISGNKKCVVIMEGDPKPGAVSGRMSFQNSIHLLMYDEKLNEEHEEIHKQRLYAASSTDGNGMNVSRENEASEYGNNGLNKNQENDASEDLQRKKQKVEKMHKVHIRPKEFCCT